ncbi:MAG: dihydrolipoyl dehydrogenase [Rhodobacteraceae bacterium]|nr:dihydrolipoyl dehydrogenase [Paracoccaceae bacterium]
MVTENFDMTVVGAGPGGYVAAIRGAQLGLKVAIVEREHLGGICLNWGCVPTKALLRSAEVFHLVERASEFGVAASAPSPDLDAMVDRSRKVANQLASGVKYLLQKNGVSTIMGAARLEAPDLVRVSTNEGDRDLRSSNVVIATGARARELPELPADGNLVWNYRHALKPPRMPRNLLVVGSGAIGIEFASFFNSLGAKTTVVEVLDRILPVEDQEISEFAKRQFVKQGMRILESARLSSIKINAGSVDATIDTGKDQVKESFDTVVSAVGIVGNVEGLGLEEAGVEVDRTHIQVDELCGTAVAGIHAIGDVAGPPWLAHKASHEGTMVAEKISGREVHPVRQEAIPGCTYCMPQVASVGLTEQQALDSGLEVRVGRFPYIGNGKAIALGEPEGLIKTIFDSSTGELLGAHMIGAEVTELIQGFVVARQLETTEEDLMHSVFPHPTLSEMMHESVLSAYGRAIHF